MKKDADSPGIPQDRRSSDDRRADDRGEADAEQRSGVDRRQQPDRRGINLTIRYTGPEAVEELRRWLEDNCDGGYSIGVPNAEAAVAWGHFRVRFERRSDLAKLARLLSVHWPSWMG